MTVFLILLQTPSGEFEPSQFAGFCKVSSTSLKLSCASWVACAALQWPVSFS